MADVAEASVAAREQVAGAAGADGGPEAADGQTLVQALHQFRHHGVGERGQHDAGQGDELDASAEAERLGI